LTEDIAFTVSIKVADVQIGQVALEGEILIQGAAVKVAVAPG